MKLLQLATAALAFTATAAIATPQYTGETTADWDLSTTSDRGFDYSIGDGYYIWNDADNTSTWYVIWTSQGKETWSGSIDFLNTSTNTIETLTWNNNDTYVDNILGEDVYFDAITNGGGYDGLTFTITESYELIELTLGSSLFEDLEVNAGTATDPGIASSYIYIGEDYNTDFTVLTGTLRFSGETSQQFEIFVPEPATMALFGLGIAGLAASRRRQKKELAA